eukprot:s1665_g9.t1
MTPFASASVKPTSQSIFLPWALGSCVSQPAMESSRSGRQPRSVPAASVPLVAHPRLHTETSKLANWCFRKPRLLQPRPPAQTCLDQLREYIRQRTRTLQVAPFDFTARLRR